MPNENRHRADLSDRNLSSAQLAARGSNLSYDVASMRGCDGSAEGWLIEAVIVGCARGVE